MTKLSIDLFNHIALQLDIVGANMIQEISVSKEGFEELVKWATHADNDQEIGNIIAVNHALKNNSFRTIKYNDAELIEEARKFQVVSPKILPLLKQGKPEINFYGYVFKLNVV